MIRYITTLLLLLTTLIAQADEQWSIYLPHNDYTRFQPFAGSYFMLSDGGLFSADASQPTHAASYSRLSGLSGTSIYDMAVTADSAYMAIVYTDGNIDIIDSTLHIVNVPDFKNKTISGDRTLRSLMTHGHDLYLSTSYCLLEVDLEGGVIRRNVILNKAIQSSFFLDGKLHICTPEAIYSASLTQNLNLPSSWTQVLEGSYVATLTFPYDGEEQVFLIGGDLQVYHYSQAWKLLYKWKCTDATILRDMGPDIFFYSWGPVLLSKDRHVFARNNQSPFTSVRDMLLTSDTTCLMLHATQGLMEVSIGAKQQNDLELHVDTLEELAPSVASPANAVMHFEHSRLMALTSLPIRYEDKTRLWNIGGGVSIYDPQEESWHTLQASAVTPHLAPGYANFRLLTSLSSDPVTDGHYAIGSLGYGLFEFMGDSLVAHFTPDNSPLLTHIGTNKTCSPSAVMYDEQGYLWIANSGTDSVLCCLTPDRRWLKYPLKGMKGELSSNITRLIESKHDPYHFKWLMHGGYNGVCIGMYFDNGTPENPMEHESCYFTSLTDQDGNIYSPYLNDLVEDLDGAIWLMTSSGPFVIDHPIDCYNTPGAVRRIKIPRNDGTNLADYLLPDVDCTCGVVDAANRKWIGTNDNGLYCISADGLQQLQHFTTTNSPLLSDDILALAYDQETGTLYISCDGGIISYLTDAIQGAGDFGNVYCYPNPVRPDYTGDLVISGLVDDSRVAITDVAGHVVYRTQSAGGRVSWDLTTTSGQRVRPGVYLIIATDPEGKEGIVSRFLVI